MNLEGISAADHADAEMYAALVRALPSPAFIIDVGANEGQFITGLAARIGVSGVCIEPGSAAFSRLKTSVAGMAGVTTLRAAIHPVDSEVELFVTRSDVGSSVLRPLPGQSSQWANIASTERVRADRLDRLAATLQWPRIDLLKVDTQGSDLDVLASSGDTLVPDKVGAVLVEVNFHEFYEHQGSFGDIYNLMRLRGYFLAEVFRRYNRKGWLWYADALFLPVSDDYST